MTQALDRIVGACVALALAGMFLGAGASAEQATPGQAPVYPRFNSVTDVVTPPGLPAIGKWMIDRDGTIAHWLGEVYQGKRLREPINVILVDRAAKNAEDAKRRLIAAATAAGYPIRFGHSTGYRGYIGGRTYGQLPAGHADAFSNRIFELSNNHGRLFGPHPVGRVYVTIGAFSREQVRLLRIPEHGYASFNRARDDFAERLDHWTQFKWRGFVPLANAAVDDAHVSTGDHDGQAVLLRADQ
jgi:hypothetical protein